ncbi:MAG: hypothetical protein CMK44_04405 [Porticoccus sp.]|jgi:glycosyltransferase involved in cell wall biosynthesis|nr:hypothetical protein [Porticoccus sp.]|tara:strand:- start:229 stop:1359 length:1131 start_codon:yes stop_codon:yes gene_type:complete
MKNMAKKIKVYIVGGFPPPTKETYGGQVTACIRLLESSFTKSYAVSTLNTSQISNPAPHFLIRLMFALKRLIFFNLYLIFMRPDVSIIFLGSGSSALEKGVMVCCARLLRVPIIVFPRAGALIKEYLCKKWFATFIRLTIGKSDLFLCQGASFQKFAIHQLGYDKSTSPIIPNWTASEEHLHIGERRKYDKYSDCPKILYLGWMEDFKGVIDLLEAVLLLRAAQINFHITFSGKGGALATARSFVKLHGLENYVSFTGWVDPAAKAALLETCEIFVLPSWSEGLPNSMIEAMSAGLACVLTSVGMIEDYVVGGRDALIVSPKNPTELADAIKILLIDCTAREKISKNGLLLARSNFTLEQGVSLLSDEINRITIKK